MFTKRNVFVCLIVLLLSGCTVRFSAEQLELDARPAQPGIHIETKTDDPNEKIAEKLYNLHSINLSTRKEILWHLLDLAAELSRSPAQ